MEIKGRFAVGLTIHFGNSQLDVFVWKKRMKKKKHWMNIGQSNTHRQDSHKAVRASINRSRLKYS